MGNRIAVISTAKNRISHMDVTYEAVPLPGVDPEEMKSMCQRDIPISMVCAAINVHDNQKIFYWPFCCCEKTFNSKGLRAFKVYFSLEVTVHH